MPQFYRAVNFDKKERLETYGDATLTSNMWLNTKFSNQLNRLMLNRWSGDHVLVLGDMTPKGVNKALKSYEDVFLCGCKTLYEATNSFRKVNNEDFSECNYLYIYDYDDMSYGSLSDMEVDGMITDHQKNVHKVCINPLIILLNGAENTKIRDYKGNNLNLFGKGIANFTDSTRIFVSNDKEDIEDYSCESFRYNDFWISSSHFKPTFFEKKKELFKMETEKNLEQVADFVSIMHQRMNKTENLSKQKFTSILTELTMNFDDENDTTLEDYMDVFISSYDLFVSQKDILPFIMKNIF